MKGNIAHDTKTTLVVMDENTLGFILPHQPNMVGILRASILKGAAWSLNNDPRPLSGSIRLATEKDFEEYRVVFQGYSNRDEYLYN